MYGTVIFDFFGVFCSSIATTWFTKTVPDAAAKLADLHALSKQSDLGKISRAEFNQAVSKLSGISAAEVERGIEAQIVINDTLAAYTEQLRAKGYRTACLSNGTHEWTIRIITDHGLGHLFDEVILSADLGIIKPDPRIYRQTLEKLGITADQAVFVDDRQLNVDGAEACGIRSLLFTDTPSFIADFEKLSATAR